MSLENIDPSILVGGVIGGFLAGAILLLVILLVALHLYFAFAWMTIAQKKKHKNAWLAWIPFANLWLILELGGFHGAWAFLILGLFIPFVWIIPALALLILLIIAHFRILEKTSYPPWLSILLAGAVVPVFGFPFVIGYLVLLGFLAWNTPKKKR